MKAIYLTVFITIVLVSFGGCKNKATKNITTVDEDFFCRDSVPYELEDISEIEFMSVTEPKRIKMRFVPNDNPGYPPLLQIRDDEGCRIFFTGNSPGRWVADDGNICLLSFFEDSLHNVSLAIEMCEKTPQGMHLTKNEQSSYYEVANYTTYDIYDDEDYDDEENYFGEVYNDIEKNSSKIENIPTTILRLVPLNFKLMFCAQGNLNRDKYQDAIIILQDEKFNYSMWILTGNSDNSYKISRMNDNIVVAGYYNNERDFENPLFDIVIKNGFFTIEQYGGVSGNNKEIHTTHFKYLSKENNWILFRSDFVPNRFLSGNCCYDFHTTKHYVEKIWFEDYGHVNN
jgi:hypothetical protein